MKLCRWTVAEYETEPLSDLSETVEPVEDPGQAEIVVVPSTRRVSPVDVPRARLVITTSSGFENLDVAGLATHGVVCARLPMARRDAVVETTLGMMLWLTRRLGLFQAATGWDRPRLREYGAVHLGRVAVVGVGVIGSRMIEVLAALGATALPVRRGEPLPDADVVTLHASLNADNVHLVDPYALRPGTILVNTARGKLLDADRAREAVLAGHLGGLGVDVFPTEPTDVTRFVHPRIVVTPHAAGWHPGLGRDIAAGVAAAVRAFVAGEPVPWSLAPRGAA